MTTISLPEQITIAVDGVSYEATRIPNPPAFDFPQMVTYNVQTPLGDVEHTLNLNSVIRTGGDVPTHIRQFVEHQERVAARYDRDGIPRTPSITKETPR